MLLLNQFVLLLVLLAGFYFLSGWLNATQNSLRIGRSIVAGCAFWSAILGFVYGVFQPTECGGNEFIRLCFPVWLFATPIGAACGVGFSVLIGIIRRTARSPRNQIRNGAILVSVIIMTLFIVERLQAYQDKIANQHHQEEIAQFQQALPIFNQSLHFTNCESTLVPSEQQSGYYDLLLTVSTVIAHQNDFEFMLSGNFGWPYIEQTKQHVLAGKQDLIFRIPTLIEKIKGSYQENVAGLNLTTNITQDGPYTIQVDLIGAQDINGRPFRMQTHLVGNDEIQVPSIKCTTKPYQVEDFGLLQKQEKKP